MGGIYENARDASIISAVAMIYESYMSPRNKSESLSITIRMQSLVERMMSDTTFQMHVCF